jgi:predicted aspartyl protease
MFVACLSVLALAAETEQTISSLASAHTAVFAAADTARQTAMARDSRGRPTIEARFNGRPPVKMVVDTAAQTSLVTLPLARELSLPALGETLTVEGAVGQSQVELYGVDRFETDLFQVEGVALLALPNAGVTEARGVIGMERFSQGRLVFDVGANRLDFAPSGEHREDFVAVQGRLNEAGLLVVPVEIDGVLFDALVDTGAGVSVASDGALRALGWAETDPRLKAAGTIRGATSHESAIRSGRVGRIKLGPVNFRDIDLIFADPEAVDEAPPESGTPNSSDTPRPSLILGADLLMNLDAFALDFQRATLEIRVPH